MEPGQSAASPAYTQDLHALNDLARKLIDKHGVQIYVAIAKPIAGKPNTETGVGHVTVWCSEHLSAAARMRQLLSPTTMQAAIRASWAACIGVWQQSRPFSSLATDESGVRLMRSTVIKVLLLAMPNRRIEFPWAKGNASATRVDEVSTMLPARSCSPAACHACLIKAHQFYTCNGSATITPWQH